MKLSKPIMRLMTLTVVPLPLYAGTLDAPSAPSSTSSYTLEDLYHRLNQGTAGAPKPTAGPGATIHTITDLMNKAPTPDNTTGATPADVATGKKFWGLTNGNWGLQTGTATISACTPNANANPVFTVNGNGTVRDNRTCLIWLQDAGCVGRRVWADVDTNAKVVTLINAASCANYTAGTFTDWRLPTIQELQSVVHYGYYNPAMSDAAGTAKWTTNGEAFSNVRRVSYWSASAYADVTAVAWVVYLGYGNAYAGVKSVTYDVWPVRGGQ